MSKVVDVLGSSYFFSDVNFFQFFVIKTLDPVLDPGPDCYSLQLKCLILFL
jgi:hypothetical protein